MRNRTSDLRIPRFDALPLSYREVLCEVHMPLVLHSVRISSVDSVMYVNRIREMESFEISKEIEKDFLFVPR